MDVVLLGTGSADGLPNPFCRCRTCSWSRRHGEVRSQTAVLVDGGLLLECGRGVGEAAARAGRDLAGVATVLLTHGDFDHADGAALLHRHWAGVPQRLEVLGPPSALSQLRSWLGPTDPVVLVPVAPVGAGAQWTRVASGHDVRALPAAHVDAGGGAGVLWEVRASDGSSVLLATDTGPLPEGTVTALRDAALDVLLLEDTFGVAAPADVAPGQHHDLAEFAATVRRLREVGAVTTASRVVAVHVSHHNPPTPELAARLAVAGAEVLPDGSVVRVGRGGSVPDGPSATPARSGHSAPRQRGSLVLVLGGARSGKSRYAEGRLADVAQVDYVATSGPRPEDPEWAARVAAHQVRRPAAWTTHESTDLERFLTAAGPPLLVDCVSLWLAAVLDEADAWAPEASPAATLAAVDARTEALLAAWRSTPRDVVAVSNEVGSGVVPATASGRLFRDELGRLNARLAEASDEVILMVAGRPLRLPPC